MHVRIGARLVSIVCFVIFGALTPCSADTTVVFNEVMYHPAADEDGLEWIELHNQMAVDVDISRWSLRGGVEFTFPAGTIVRGGDFLVVSIAPATLASAARLATALGPYSGRLANGGERLELRNNSGRLMDWLEYRDDGDWPPGADGSGASLAKIDPDTASFEARSWAASARIGGTPGAGNFAASGRRQTIVPIDSDWKYDASGADRGTAWRTSAYDDRDWTVARAPMHHTPADPPLRWTGRGNRLSPHDFGSSRTNRAGGGAPGELGGTLERSPAAWFADLDIGPLDAATDDLFASVRWMQEGNGNVTFGYFQSASYGVDEDPVGLYWRIDDVNVYAAVKKPGGPLAEQLVGSLAAGVPAIITLRWTAATRTFTVAIDGGPSESIAVSGPVEGLTPDGFGVLTLGAGGGYAVTVWADDAEYTVGTPARTQRMEAFGGAGPPAGARTELPAGPRTYYFRTTFEYRREIHPIPTFFQPVARDGAVVYLNGVEVSRYNMPAGPVAFATPAAATAVASGVPQPIRLPPERLVEGSNTLAVEVHLAPESRGDVVFGGTVFTDRGPWARRSASAVVINELPPAADAAFWVELFNRGDVPLDLAGYVLVRSGNDRTEHVIKGGSIAAGGYLLLRSETLGFRAADGDKLFLLTPDRQNLVDGAVVTTPPRARQEERHRPWLRPSASTPGTANTFALHGDIVINEIMYHGLSPTPSDAAPGAKGGADEAWIELYNRGTGAIDLSGWSLADAVDFAFAGGTSLAPGEYIVVAKDAAAVEARHPGLHVAGQFTRDLSSRSNRILLLDAAGNPADDVRYFDRGRWDALADGGGSSLELRDGDADNSRPAAWAASDEAARSEWKLYSYRGTAVSVVPGDPGEPHVFQIGFLDAPGDVLIDDVRVTRDPDGSAVQLIANSGFDVGSTAGWKFSGTHRHSRVIADPQNAGNHVLRVTAGGPTDTVFNHVVATLGEPARDGEQFEITFRARWVSGSRQLNTRLYYNRLPRTTLLDVPARGGTPGAPNSRRMPNLGPTFDGLEHWPVTPVPGAPVAVSVRASDGDGVAAVSLWWAVDEGGWRRIQMVPDAHGGYVASIPGQAAGSIVQFYVEGTDGAGASAFGPPGGRQSRALYAVASDEPSARRIHTFRTLMLRSDAERVFEDARQSNERVGGTAVWKDVQPYYDVGIRLRGSLHAGRLSGAAGHSVEFQPDHLFRGVHPTVAIDLDARGERSVREILLHHVITHAGGMPGMYNDIVHAVAPLPQGSGTAMMRMAAHGDVFLESRFEDGDEGTIHESEGIAADRYTYVEFMDLGDDKEFYRWNFTIQNNRRKDDYRGLMALAKTLGMPPGPELERRAAEVMDVDQWMRVFAMQALGAVSDTYLHDGNHNLRVYARPSDGRVLAFPWDLDGAFSGSPFPWGKGNLTKVIERTPYTRMYYWHLHDIVATTYNVGYMSRWLRHYGELAGEDFSEVLEVIAGRVRNTELVLPPRVPFTARAAAAPAGTMVTLEGTAWLDVHDIRVTGSDAPVTVTWTTLQDWRAEIPFSAGAPALTVEAFDRTGERVAEATVDLAQ